MELVDPVVNLLNSLLEHPSKKPSFMKIHKQVYDCTISSNLKIEFLYAELAKALEHYCCMSLYTLEQLDAKLLEYSTYWESYYRAILIFDKCSINFNKIILHSSEFYLNEDYREEEKFSAKIQKYPRMSIFGLGLFLWYTNVLLKLNSHKQFTTYLVNEIGILRKSQSDFKSDVVAKLKSCIVSFHSVGTNTASEFYVYNHFFEQHLLRTSESYYSHKYNLLIHSISDKMKDAFTLIKYEELLATTLLIHSSFTKIQQLINKCVVSKLESDILEALPLFISSFDPVKSHYSYLLLKRLPLGINNIQSIISYQVKLQGITIINRHKVHLMKKPSLFISDLALMKESFVTFTKDAFNSDSECIAAIDQGFVLFLNSKDMPIAIASFTAKYFDYILRKNIDIDKLPIAVDLFRYIKDKDLFSLYYSKYLTKRILSLHFLKELELQQIEAFQLANGQEYTFKLFKMISDITTSSELTKLANIPHCEANILSTGSWPIQEQENLVLPSDIQDKVDQFESFYSTKFVGRKLKWAHEWSRITIKVNTTYPFEIDCPIPCYLLLVDIANNIKIDSLHFYLQSFLSLGFITKLNNIYTINKDYKPKKYMLRIPFQFAFQKEEEELVNEQMKQDRKYFLMALISKELKEKKRINHAQLISFVIHKTINRFKPSTSSIKEAIDMLIERQYLKRDPNNQNELLFIS